MTAAACTARAALGSEVFSHALSVILRRDEALGLAGASSMASGAMGGGGRQTKAKQRKKKLKKNKK